MKWEWNSSFSPYGAQEKLMKTTDSIWTYQGHKAVQHTLLPKLNNKDTAIADRQEKERNPWPIFYHIKKQGQQSQSSLNILCDQILWYKTP